MTLNTPTIAPLVLPPVLPCSDTPSNATAGGADILLNIETLSNVFTDNFHFTTNPNVNAWYEME